MKTILFVMFKATSHLNATFPLARRLRERGYKVIYSVPSHLAPQITGKGFEPLIHEPYLTAFPLNWHLRSKDDLEHFVKSYENGTIFNDMLARVQPDLIILDTTFVNYSIELLLKKIPVYMIQTMCSVKKKSNVPPICSSIIPRKNILSKIRIEAAWQLYFFKRKLLHLSTKSFFKKNEFQLMREKAVSANVPLSSIKFNTFLHPSVEYFPEIILPSREFDFPQQKLPHEIYFGYEVDEERRNHPPHIEYENLKHEIFNKPVYYLSAGSLFGLTEKFVKKIARIFKKRPDVNLILHVGQLPLQNHPQLDLPKNVFMFSGFLPQLEILKKSKLMMTHGGVNSIMECIYFEVPMIVFPVFKHLDQTGNAARVTYHRIGLRGTFSESANSILKKITKIENKALYLENIKNLKMKIFSNDAKESFLVQLDKALDYNAS
jgi:zeaxanthin glucosyltransferase